MEIEKSKELLKCFLTEAELRTQADTMAQSLSQIQSLESDLKSLRKQIESDIAAAEGALNSAVEKFRSGWEMRSIDCEIRKDFETNTVLTVRLDTGEIIRQRAMTAEERQMALELGKEKEEPSYTDKKMEAAGGANG